MADFTLNIELGSEAMLTAEDIAYALRTTANRVALDADGWIHDMNGNRVGNWVCEAVEDEDEEERCDRCSDPLSACECEDEEEGD